MEFSTIPQLFLQVTDKYRGNSSHPAYRHKVGDHWEDISYDFVREQSESLATGLRQLGVGRGDFVGIVSENRIEWIIADFAITGIGAVDVPIFPTLTSAQAAYIFEHCQAKVIFVSNKMQLAKILKVRAQLPALERIIVMSEDARSDDPLVLTLNDVIAKGRESTKPDVRRQEFEQLCRQVQPDDLLTIIYTSGTTGNPKGVMLTHRNMVANMRGAMDAIKLSPQDVLLSYLPLCHSYERMAGFYTAFAYEATVAFAQSIETVASNLQEIRPTFMTSVPRLFERIKTRIISRVERDKPIKQKIFHWAIATGKRYCAARRSGAKPLLLGLKYRIADRLVFGTIRERTGGRLRFLFSGGAALQKELGEFFEAVGLIILEGYGLSESSPVLTVNRPESFEFGSVGKALANVEIAFADDGEILARGDNIMQGYLHDEDATREALDEDGWLHTGDIGSFNKEGNLVITDRKKSIFVSSGGKNIAPQPIENALAQSKYVDQIILIGEMRDYCTALIVPDFEVMRAFAQDKGLAVGQDGELTSHDAVVREIRRELDHLLRDFSKFEKVRKFKLLDQPFTVENGLMTPTLKVKRKVVEKHYADLIELMYQ